MRWVRRCEERESVRSVLPSGVDMYDIHKEFYGIELLKIQSGSWFSTLKCGEVARRRGGVPKGRQRRAGMLSRGVERQRWRTRRKEGARQFGKGRQGAGLSTEQGDCTEMAQQGRETKGGRAKEGNRGGRQWLSRTNLHVRCSSRPEHPSTI
ncbi:hypothetical protein EJB05_50382, partial [Eragrostis curvula]